MAAVVCLVGSLLLGHAGASPVQADTFGLGPNQFTIEFVTIDSQANPAAGRGVVDYDYRIGVYEVTNHQWSSFLGNIGGALTGGPPSLYDQPPTFIGPDKPVNRISWFEAARFVNWLNTDRGQQPAYLFETNPQSGELVLGLWSSAEAAHGGTNLYRHKDAFYFLPVIDEWVKAAYFNGSTLQEWATPTGAPPRQGLDFDRTGWNYGSFMSEAWDVGSGSVELNGTYDMMGNLIEWLESPEIGGVYAGGYSYPFRANWGGSYIWSQETLGSSFDQWSQNPSIEGQTAGFRVAALVPEPATASLLLVGLLLSLKRRTREA